MRLKAEEEARLSEESRPKLEEHERAQLKVEGGVCLTLEARRGLEEEEQQQHVWLKSEEEARLVK